MIAYASLVFILGHSEYHSTSMPSAESLEGQLSSILFGDTMVPNIE